MFEQSILTQPNKRTWSLAVSLVVQTSLIAVSVLIPLIYTDQLPGLSKWARSLVAPAPPPANQPVEQKQQVMQQASRESNVFRAPRSVPHEIILVNDVDQRIEPPPDGVVGIGAPPTVGNTLTQFFTNIMPVPKPPEPRHATPPPTETTRVQMRVSEGVQAAKILRKIIPVYPPLAITTRTQGMVHLVGVIGKDGTIRDLKVIDGHPLLIRPALDAVKQWIYKPTLLSGEPVEVVAPITVTFTLSR